MPANRVKEQHELANKQYHVSLLPIAVFSYEYMTEKSGCYIKGEVFYRGWCYSLMNGSP